MSIKDGRQSHLLKPPACLLILMHLIRLINRKIISLLS